MATPAGSPGPHLGPDPRDEGLRVVIPVHPADIPVPPPDVDDISIAEANFGALVAEVRMNRDSLNLIANAFPEGPEWTADAMYTQIHTWRGKEEEHTAMVAQLEEFRQIFPGIEIGTATGLVEAICNGFGILQARAELLDTMFQELPGLGKELADVVKAFVERTSS